MDPATGLYLLTPDALSGFGWLISAPVAGLGLSILATLAGGRW